MADRSLRFDLVARDKSFSKTLDAAGRKGERLNRQFTRTLGDTGDRAGREFGLRLNKRLGSGLSASARVARVGAGAIGAGLAAAGLVSFAKDSVQLAATFDKTMRQVAQVTRTPTKRIAELRKVALDMGATTSFSAREAGDAMLALGKGGLTFAEQKAGALQATLTLAAAGNLELGDAADDVVQGLRAFGLGADKAANVAAALAGAANASTSNVEDMGLALAQTAAGARNAGLSIEETTGVLAAFANNGIRGSDAGTSLKTMLASLIPNTKKAKDAMADLGLKFIDAHGAILPITEIAQRLQDRLGKLSEAQRTAALRTIFGSDATRAATILMREGAAGLAKYIKATRDRGAAEELAKTNTQGAAGAFERLQGAIETVQIQIGDAFLPKLAEAAEWLARVLPAALETVQGALASVGRWWDNNRVSVLLLTNALRMTFAPAADEAAGAIGRLDVSAHGVQETLDRTLEVIARVSQGWNLLVQGTYETAAAFADLIIGAGYAANAVDKISGGTGHAADEVVRFGRAVKENAIDNINRASDAIDTAQASIDNLATSTGRAAGNADGHAAAVRRERDAINQLRSALDDEKSADIELRQAKLNLQVAQKRLNELSGQGKQRSFEYKQAELDLERAQIRVRHATDDFRVAAQRSTAATSGAMQATQRASDAHRILTRRFGDSGRAARHFGDQVRDGLLQIPKGRIIVVSAKARLDSQRLYFATSSAAIRERPAQRGLRIPGYGGGDRVPILAEAGETVVPKEAARAPEFQAWAASKRIPGYRRGGVVGRYADGGNVRGGVGVQFQSSGVPKFRAGLRRFNEDLQQSVIDAAKWDLTRAAVGANIPHTAGSWRLATQFLTRLGIPYSIVSTFRPGARTHASGAVSYHALNRAVDLDGGHDKMAIWSALTRTNPTELIYSRAPYYISRRGRRPISALDPITRADHYSHVHAAYDKGGWLMPGTTVAHNRTNRPERILPPGDTGAVNLHVELNFSGPVIGDTATFAREVTPQIRRHLKDQLRREGKIALASQL